MDIAKIRKDFPILSQNIYGKPLVYLDNAATTQKPVQVMRAMNEVYETYNGNIHRGVHYLSEKSTTVHEETRKFIADFINAESSGEIIFTRGTTESVNLIANTFAEAFINEGDEILITEMEHHSNFVPWQMVCKRKNAVLKVLKIEEDGSLSVDKLTSMMTDRTKILSVTQVSNVLGTINPVKEIIKIAHERDIPVMIDAAQSIQHMTIDVRDLDCDFLAFSGHKLYGPTGIGVLYGKEKWLEKLPPYQGGGEMIEKVSIEETTYNSLPYKFEAGTPNYVGTIGMGAALMYMDSIGMENIAAHENEVYQYAMDMLQSVPDIKFIGTADNKVSVISFLIGDLHPYDIGTMIDKNGVAVRTGTHCAEPIMRYYGIAGTLRASIGLYNSKEDIEHFVNSLKKVVKILSTG
ncbi:MAG: aminotransferase class V-fold PLP-dependent enzyme [Bacteroidales bacterium]